MNTTMFAEAMSMVDDKYYEEAANYQRGKKAARLRWEALAACLCMVAACVVAAMHPWGMSDTPTPNPNGTIERVPEPDKYPPADIMPGFTPDEPSSGNVFPIVFNEVDEAPAGVAGMIALMVEDFRPMSAEESLDYFGVKLPEDGIAPGLQLTGGGCFGDSHGLYRSGERGVYYDVNAYEFTDGDKRVTLTLRTLFHMAPSLKQVKNGPEHIEFTQINGWELALFQYEDENGTRCVYTEFALDGVTCTLSASGLGKNELAAALMSLLPQREHVPGPVTVTGAVTHVDSRKSDYFDGVRHHYSEDHDFITVDCGGTRLTVWLPGEANRFRVGDSVTVTYNGEPATVRNIWPGQLVSVE